MNDQVVLNVLGGVCLAGIGWWVKTIWERVTKLEASDASMVERVHTIELLVIGDYVKKDDLARTVEMFMQRVDLSDKKMERRLDSIDSKLDNKQDKSRSH